MHKIVSFLADRLSAAQKEGLALDLAKGLGDARDNNLALCELVDCLSPSTILKIYPYLFRYCISILQNKEEAQNEKHEEILILTRKVPQLYEELLKETLHLLSSYVKIFSPTFLKDFIDISQEFPEIGIDTWKSRDLKEEENFEVTSVATILKSWQIFFEKETTGNNIETLLCFMLGSRDDIIADCALNLLRWRIDHLIELTSESEFVWRIIFSLAKSSNNSTRDRGLILWLRYLKSSKSNLIANSGVYQEKILQDEHMWSKIQAGLTSLSHENKKYCLSILQLTVTFINRDIKNSLVNWDNGSRRKHIEEWMRFITIYEFSAIDTSVHQMEAAVNDIISFISPDSTIHPSWGICLLANGFKSSMESLRRFCLSILLSLPPENVHVLKHGLTLLEEIILPTAMVASHFVVTKNEKGSFCEFGNRLTDFVSRLFEELENDEELRTVAYSILKVLKNSKQSFSASRTFIALGLLRGLEGQKVLSYEAHGPLLVNLFDSSFEGEVYNDVNQSIYLHLILNFKFPDVNKYFEMLDRFVKFNGFGLIRVFMDRLTEYLIEFKNFKESLKDLISVHNSLSTNIVTLLVAFVNVAFAKPFEVLHSLFVSTSKETLVKMLVADLNVSNLFENELLSSVLKKFLSHVIEDAPDTHIYEILSQVDFETYGKLLPVRINLVNLWASINSQTQADNEVTLKLLCSKLELFAKIFGLYSPKGIENYELFSIKSLLKFNNLIFLNYNEATKRSKDLYKFKDLSFGLFYKILSSSMKKDSPSQSDIEEVLKIINPLLINYRANFEVAKLVETILSSANTSSRIFERCVILLFDMWSNIEVSKLMSNQKQLHLLIINLMCLPSVLIESLHNTNVSERVHSLSKSVILNAQGRRCLLPSFTRCLSEFQIEYPMMFEKLLWLAEILVLSSIVRQPRDHLFRLENIIADIYDHEILKRPENKFYNKIYGPDEVASKVNLMALLNSLKTSKFSEYIVNYILDNDHILQLSKISKSSDTYEETKRLQLVRILLSVHDRMETETLYTEVLPKLMQLVENDPSPLVRIYYEWMLALIGFQSRQILDKFFHRLKYLIGLQSSRPVVINIYLRILFLIIKKLFYGDEAEMLNELLSILVPAATSNKAFVRHFSVSLLHSIYLEVSEKNLSVDISFFTIIENMYNYAIHTEGFGQFRSGDACLWDIKKDFTLVNITGIILMRVSDHEVEFIKRDTYLQYLTSAQSDRLRRHIGYDLEDLWVRERKKQKQKELRDISDICASQSEPLPLQTKSGAWDNSLDIDSNENEYDIKRSDLVVVSSLVDKTPNLGGICRLCDALGAGLLALHDIGVTKTAQFKNVAVTADNWMPMIEVKPDAILEFLRDKKREGYALIGLEQTDRSVELNEKYKFPRKSLVLLGKEKEGIPGTLLAELDSCVEIKQVGVVRSMNIQTVTSIIVHAYATQHC